MWKPTHGMDITQFFKNWIVQTQSKKLAYEEEVVQLFVKTIWIISLIDVGFQHFPSYLEGDI